MRDLTLISKSLHSKIEKLVHLHGKLKDDNKKLLAEKQALVKKAAEYEGAVKKMEEDALKVKLALTLSKSTEQTTDIKLKINELVREIDKCIALLNK
jgi:SMC interacting uncharacterized protein involved in chromosome segregation